MDPLQLAALVGLVVAAVVVFFFTRKKTDAKQLARGDAHEGRRLPSGRPAPKGADAEPTGSDLPQDLPSSDVLPAESVASLPAVAPEPPKKRRSVEEIAAMRKGLGAARGGFVAKLAALFRGKTEIDPSILDELEEVLLTSDVGVKTTGTILERLKARVDKRELADSDAVWTALRAEASAILSVERAVPKGTTPHVVLVVGVNGVGKTTTIGKLATRLVGEGKKVVLAAGDTFRAAAVQQLEVWGKRVGADVVRGKDGADPGAVAFEAVTRAKESGADVVLVDSAGRLHTKAPLMDELRKVKKSLGKALDGAPHEILLVLDATTGQNGLQQASVFTEAVEPNGLVLTKLDGTAKGGIVLGIADELGLPVRFVGLGERAEDLRAFDADAFVEALFGTREEADAAA